MLWHRTTTYNVAPPHRTLSLIARWCMTSFRMVRFSHPSHDTLVLAVGVFVYRRNVQPASSRAKLCPLCSALWQYSFSAFGTTLFASWSVVVANETHRHHPAQLVGSCIIPHGVSLHRGWVCRWHTCHGKGLRG